MSVLRVALAVGLTFTAVASSARITRSSTASRLLNGRQVNCAAPGPGGNPDPCCQAATPDPNYCAAPGQLKNADPLCKSDSINPDFCVGPNDPIDPEDLSYIHTWAAIGDSYAAGIGAGNELDYQCRRYDGGYPSLMNADARLGDPVGRTFTNVACSGAHTKEVIEQANSLRTGQQVITISAGGNDAGLVNILNDCVYNWYGGFSDDCDATIQASEAIINNPDFATSLTNTIQAAQAKLASGGMIFYTGYAKFFDVTTNECDTVSWHYWLNLWSKQFLTQARRIAMNDMVDLVNSKIAAAVQQAGAGVNFINYDDYFGQLEGRYCQPGVDETKKKGAENRVGLLFFETKTKDIAWGLPVWGPEDVGGLNDKRALLDTTTSLHEVNVTAMSGGYWDGKQGVSDRQDISQQQPQHLAARNTLVKRQDIPATDPRDIVEDINDDISRAFLDHPDAQLDPDIVPDDIVPFLQAEGVKVPTRRDIANKIPVSWARVFHPQQAGHLLIANQVLNRLASFRYTALGIYPPQEAWKGTDTCPR